MCRAVDTMQARFSTSFAAPTGLEVIFNPRLRAPRARTLTSALARGARPGPRFSTGCNYDTNEKSANQRVTRGQEDGFDTLLQLQNSLSL